jgi:transcriptional regulator with XRE-family HTH domain
MPARHDKRVITPAECLITMPKPTIHQQTKSVKQSKSFKKSEQVDHDPEPLGRQLGERILALRDERGWSLEVLAEASGVSRSMLSEIERSKANPTLVVTYRIAKAFGLGISELIEPTGGTPTIQVVRANDPAQVFRADKRHQVRTLSPLSNEKDVEFYEIRLPVKGELRSQGHIAGTRELLVVAAGEIRLESGSDVQMLTAGDSAIYRADLPHALVNFGSDEAVMYLVDVYR